MNNLFNFFNLNKFKYIESPQKAPSPINVYFFSVQYLLQNFCNNNTEMIVIFHIVRKFRPGKGNSQLKCIRHFYSKDEL